MDALVIFIVVYLAARLGTRWAESGNLLLIACSGFSFAATFWMFDYLNIAPIASNDTFELTLFVELFALGCFSALMFGLLERWWHKSRQDRT
jgi:hypothetical protein